jgi:hypothetical protein
VPCGHQLLQSRCRHAPKGRRCVYVTVRGQCRQGKGRLLHFPCVSTHEVEQGSLHGINTDVSKMASKQSPACLHGCPVRGCPVSSLHLRGSLERHQPCRWQFGCTPAAAAQVAFRAADTEKQGGIDESLAACCMALAVTYTQLSLLPPVTSVVQAIIACRTRLPPVLAAELSVSWHTHIAFHSDTQHKPKEHRNPDQWHWLWHRFQNHCSHALAVPVWPCQAQLLSTYIAAH